MQLTLKIPCSQDEIKEEVARLCAEIDIRKAELNILSEAVRHYRKQCNHPGQKTGYNERDGDWANPCPVCGESH